MKKFLVYLIISLIVISCTKETTVTVPPRPTGGGPGMVGH
jgi:hypothetical protein